MNKKYIILIIVIIILSISFLTITALEFNGLGNEYKKYSDNYIDVEIPNNVNFTIKKLDTGINYISSDLNISTVAFDNDTYNEVKKVHFMAENSTDLIGNFTNNNGTKTYVAVLLNNTTNSVTLIMSNNFSVINHTINNFNTLDPYKVFINDIKSPKDNIPWSNFLVTYIDYSLNHDNSVDIMDIKSFKKYTNNFLKDSDNKFKTEEKDDFESKINYYKQNYWGEGSENEKYYRDHPEDLGKSDDYYH